MPARKQVTGVEINLDDDLLARGVDPVRAGLRDDLDAGDPAPILDPVGEAPAQARMPEERGRPVARVVDRSAARREARRRHGHPVGVDVVRRHRVVEHEGVGAGAVREGHGPGDRAHLEPDGGRARHRDRLGEGRAHPDGLARQVVAAVRGRARDRHRNPAAGRHHRVRKREGAVREIGVPAVGASKRLARLEPERVRGDAHPVGVRVARLHQVEERLPRIPARLDPDGLALGAADVQPQPLPCVRPLHRLAERHPHSDGFVRGVEPVRPRADQ